MPARLRGQGAPATPGPTPTPGPGSQLPLGHHTTNTANEGNGGNGHDDTHLATRLRFQARMATGLGATTETRGSWVWAQFPGIPSATTRATMKTAGWIWAPHHGKWAYREARSNNHGKSMSWGYIASKYPTKEEEN